MREENGARYQRIRETIQLIAPFFDEFVLEPQMKGESELVRLEWRQKGSSFPFQPWQFSDRHDTIHLPGNCAAATQAPIHRRH